MKIWKLYMSFPHLTSGEADRETCQTAENTLKCQPVNFFTSAHFFTSANPYLVDRFKERWVRNRSVFPSIPKLSEIIHLEVGDLLERKDALLVHLWKAFHMQYSLIDAWFCHIIKTSVLHSLIHWKNRTWGSSAVEYHVSEDWLDRGKCDRQNRKVLEKNERKLLLTDLLSSLPSLANLSPLPDSETRSVFRSGSCFEVVLVTAPVQLSNWWRVHLGLESLRNFGT